MDVGVEISFYPLHEQPLGPIRGLIRRLHELPGLRVETNSLSTQLFGDYDRVMQAVTEELRAALSVQYRSVVVMKIVGPLEG